MGLLYQPLPVMAPYLRGPKDATTPCWLPAAFLASVYSVLRRQHSSPPLWPHSPDAPLGKAVQNQQDRPPTRGSASSTDWVNKSQKAALGASSDGCLFLPPPPQGSRGKPHIQHRSREEGGSRVPYPLDLQVMHPEQLCTPSKLVLGPPSS